jgi:hypothetical protein
MKLRSIGKLLLLKKTPSALQERARQRENASILRGAARRAPPSKDGEPLRENEHVPRAKGHRRASGRFERAGIRSVQFLQPAAFYRDAQLPREFSIAPICPCRADLAADTLLSGAAAFSRRNTAHFCRAAGSIRKSETEISRIEHKQKAPRMRDAFCSCSLGGNAAVG